LSRSSLNENAELNRAREAKSIVGQNLTVREYSNGIGITRADGIYCVKVNLGKAPPDMVLSSFPRSVMTSGGAVRVVYDTTGKIRT
jgi:hypothetical protein